MKNDKIGEVLRTYRKLRHMTVPEVCMKLKDDYDIVVAEKTVYGWESNQAHPTADTLIAVCDLYRIDQIAGVFTDRSGEAVFALSKEEEDIIRNYRRFPQYQNAIRQLLHMPAKVRRSNRE